MDTASRSPGLVAPPAAASAADPAPEMADTSFLEPIERTFASLKRLATNYALLGVLDARRAAMQFAWLIAAGILICVLVVTAWLAGVVALAVWLFGQGMSWPAVLGIAAAMNLSAAMLVGLKVRRVFDETPFSALLRQIKAEPPGNNVEP